LIAIREFLMGLDVVAKKGVPQLQTAAATGVASAFDSNDLGYSVESDVSEGSSNTDAEASD
jgi:hypothetical protein